MAGNLVEVGDTNPKSQKWDGARTDRAERVQDLGIDLPKKSGDIIDELLDLAELGKKAQEQKRQQARELREKARDLETEWRLDE